MRVPLVGVRGAVTRRFSCQATHACRAVNLKRGKIRVAVICLYFLFFGGTLLCVCSW